MISKLPLKDPDAKSVDPPELLTYNVLESFSLLNLPVKFAKKEVPGIDPDVKLKDCLNIYRLKMYQMLTNLRYHMKRNFLGLLANKNPHIQFVYLHWKHKFPIFHQYQNFYFLDLMSYLCMYLYLNI